MLTHHKTIEVAAALKIQPVQVMAHMSALWLWCIDNAADGCLTMAPSVIAHAAQWKRDSATFIDALVASHFLDPCDHGGLDIHNWDVRAGRLIEMREKNNERVRLHRLRNAHVTTDVTGTQRARNDDVTGLRTETTDGDKERREEDERTNVTRTAPGAPAAQPPDGGLSPPEKSLPEPELPPLRNGTSPPTGPRLSDIVGPEFVGAMMARFGRALDGGIGVMTVMHQASEYPKFAAKKTQKTKQEFLERWLTTAAEEAAAGKPNAKAIAKAMGG